MSWRMIGTPILTADISAPIAVSQRFSCTDGSYLLKGCQVGIILYNDPAFTSLEARIYSDSVSAPKTLIATSTNSYTKAEVLTAQIHGMKNIGFSFNGIPLVAGDFYHLVLFPNGYTGTDASHIAWRMSYPDPQYRTGITLDAAHGDNHHLEFSLIGEEIK